MEKSEPIAVENGGGVKGAGTEKNEAIAVENNCMTEKTEDNEAREAGKKNSARTGQKKKKKKKKVQSKVVIGAADATAAVVASEGGARGCRVQVSNTKKPLFFYLNVAKRYIKQNNFVELSALGMAIPTVVTISEILKKDGWATEKKIGTSTVTLKDEARGRVMLKAKIEIVLEKHKNSEKPTGSAANGPSEISKKEESAESNGDLTEREDSSETDGTLIEKKDAENTYKKLAEGKKASANNGERLLMKKDTYGSNGKMTDKENIEVAVAAAGN